MYSFNYDADAALSALVAAMVNTLPAEQLYRVITKLDEMDGTPGVDAAAEAIMTSGELSAKYSEAEWAAVVRAQQSLVGEDKVRRCGTCALCFVDSHRCDTCYESNGFKNWVAKAEG